MSAACASSSDPIGGWRWDKAAATEEAFAQDRHHCVLGATRSEGFFDSPRADPARFATCMHARGYTRSPTGRFGAPPAP